MRFVAVSVDQHDVSWTDKGLHGDLVGGRSAIRSEKQLSASKGPCCLFLGNPDIASWFEQRIQTASRGGRFSQKDGGSIKMAEVTNPVGVENRLPSGNRQSVECADRTARVIFEVIEIRCVVALVHALHQSEMDFHQVFQPIKIRRMFLESRWLAIFSAAPSTIR